MFTNKNYCLKILFYKNLDNNVFHTNQNRPMIEIYLRDLEEKSMKIPITLPTD